MSRCGIVHQCDANIVPKVEAQMTHLEMALAVIVTFIWLRVGNMLLALFIN